MDADTPDNELLSSRNIHAIDEGLLQKSIHKQIDKDIQHAELEDQRVRFVKRLSGLNDDIKYYFNQNNVYCCRLHNILSCMHFVYQIYGTGTEKPSLSNKRPEPFRC